MQIESIEDRRGRWFGIDRIGRFAARLKKIDIPLVHFHYALPDSIIWTDVLAARLANKKVVVSLHHIVGGAWPRSGFSQRVKQHIARRCVDRFIVTTQAGSNVVGQRVDAARIAVVPCGLPGIKQSDRAAARRQLWPNEEHDSLFVVTCVCRTVPYKGVFELAEAVAELSATFPKLRLVVIGTGPDHARLIAEWGKCPAMRIVGHVPDVQPWLAASDVFAMSSAEEGFGIAFAEAAQHAVPSIAGDLPSVRDVVMDGQTGWLVRPRDTRALVDVLRRAMSDPSECKRRGAAARIHVKQFEIGDVVDRLVAVYDEVLAS